jgi:hypothetical protein
VQAIGQRTALADRILRLVPFHFSSRDRLPARGQEDLGRDVWLAGSLHQRRVSVTQGDEMLCSSYSLHAGEVWPASGASIRSQGSTTAWTSDREEKMTAIAMILR